MKKTLVVLAAGIGSRFKGGIKQLTPVGPNGEVIIDYSIHDAVKAGFNKIVFIIRKDIEKNFKECIGNRTEAVCSKAGVEVAYVFQNSDEIPAGIADGRVKPWGTAHAIMFCDGVVDGPFAVINADDYYGTDSFEQASRFLETGGYGLVGYILKNTLSENGGVSRGICTVEDGKLTDIEEIRHIMGNEKACEADGRQLSPDSTVSMNFWCLPADFIGFLKENFPAFLSSLTDPMKEEYMLPAMVDRKIDEGCDVTVLTTDSRWFGVTFMEDKPRVIEGFRKLYESGVYNNDLYSDII